MKITFKTFLLAGFVLGGAFYGFAQTKEQREQIIKNYDLKKLEGGWPKQVLEAIGR